MHATILAYMFSLVEMNRITVPLGPNITTQQNMIYVQDFLANLLKAAFPHLNELVLKIFCIFGFFFISLSRSGILFSRTAELDVPLNSQSLQILAPKYEQLKRPGN